MEIDEVLDEIIYRALRSHPAAQLRKRTADNAEVSSSNLIGLSGKTNTAHS